MLKLGSHVGMSGRKMMLGSVEEALSYGANTFMIYTGAPQNTRRKDISELNIDAAWKLMEANDIHEFVIHAPYIINLGNTINPDTYQLATDFLRLELTRADTFDHILGKDQIAVFHINDSKNPCGAHKDRHENLGKGYIGFDALSYIVHHPDFSDVPKILETPWIPIDGDKKNTRAPYKEEIALLRGDS